MDPRSDGSDESVFEKYKKKAVHLPRLLLRREQLWQRVGASL